MYSISARNLLLKRALSSSSKNLINKNVPLIRNTVTNYLSKGYPARSFHSEAQAAIVPILPTLLFSIPLCIPYLFALRMAASKALTPQLRTKISYSFGSALLIIPTAFLFTSDTAPNTSRKRFMLLWPWEERRLVSKANECIENVVESEEIIPEDDVRSKLINHVLDRLWDNDFKLKKPTVYLIKNDEMLDGVSYPCSAITLTTCWLRLINYDEDLLAVILSHEIAHILQNHASEFYGLSFTLKALSHLHDLFSAVLGIIPGINKLKNESNWARPLVYLQKHSQTLEKEADLLGQEIMANAGYDPAKAIELWELICRVPSVQVPDDSHHDDGHGVRHSSESSHPPKEQRVKYLTENLMNVQKIYENTIIRNDRNFQSFESDLGLRRLELTVLAIFSQSPQ